MRCPPHPDGFRHVSRTLCALAGGTVATTADRDDAAAIEGRWPGTSAQIRAAREFHARAAAWSVLDQGARSLLVAPAGYPCDPDPHAAALASMPGTGVVLADIDDEVTLVNQAVHGADPRVAAILSAASAPGALLSRPEVRSLPRPVCVLLPFAAGMLPPDVAEAMLGGYGRLLPAGSVVALSLWLPDGSPAGGEFLRDWTAKVAPAYPHTAGDVARWVKAAGLEVLGPGVRDVRSRAGREWAEPELARRSPGRMAGVVARVP